ncbi:spore coat protein U domain-containing protein [Alsobacter sp. KACC 23698]|uniref:Spore coat protein U domain-containing protein n=1 Tax=Alsobacter sp. KACC 23698 TaxID=3149229 RepID=A0AAU7J9J8_9HYPH
MPVIRGLRRLLRAWFIVLGLAGLGAAILTGEAVAQAPSCSVAVDNLTFGSTVATTSLSSVTTLGRVTMTCTGAPSSAVRGCLDIGAGSGGQTVAGVRTLAAGANTLQYDLYSDPSFTSVWTTATGRGPALDVTLGAGGTGSATASIYARLPLPQITAPVGAYASSFSGFATLRYGPLASMSCAGGSAGATAPASFTVSAGVTPACSLSAGNLNFGSFSSITALIQASFSFPVTCTKDSPYLVYLDGGLTGATDPQARLMKRTGGTDTIKYGVYRGAGCTLPWGSTLGSGLSAIGTGSAQNHVGYGCIQPAGNAPYPAAGVYRDTIVVTVEY